tara:strand:- start:33505 stop:34401 length:897 start_codon:yes stop_codon:yes gene_type:complete
MQTIPSRGQNDHVPVLEKDVLTSLNVPSNGVVFDGTLGGGGHAVSILKLLTGNGHFIGTDKDKDAVLACSNRLKSSHSRISLYHESYHNIDIVLGKVGLRKVNCLLLDLGLSSLQLNNRKRGFSFNSDSFLDMRFNQEQSLTASNIINDSTESELADIMFYFGQERLSKRIARRIKNLHPIYKVSDLVEAVRQSTPPKHRNKTLARVFQSIRIMVNNELECLDIFLDRFINYLSIGGRIAIISFHSLEDRKVKVKYKQLSKEGKLKIVSKKPITPTYEEIINNRRCRSAKLRVAERVS